MVLPALKGVGLVTKNGGSGLASTYLSLADIITDLNTAMISSPVAITLSANEIANNLIHSTGGISCLQVKLSI